MNEPSSSDTEKSLEPLQEQLATIKIYQDKLDEVTEYLQSREEGVIRFSTQTVRELAEAGLISKEVSDWFFENEEQLLNGPPKFSPKDHSFSLEDLRQNPEKAITDLNDLMSNAKTAILSGQLIMCLLQHQNIPTQRTLFTDADGTENFGISNCISNALYHLKEILEKTALVQMSDNMYEARGKITNATGEAIGLTYSFPASSQEEAEKALSEYKSAMLTKGLKTLLAHWVMANRQGNFDFACPMIEIMKLSSDEDRESFFSVKEKEEHWAITKMLGMSRLSRERTCKKRGTNTPVVQWIEQPLVEIIGGEKEMTAEDKYPTMLAVRVLMPRIDKKGFAPNVYVTRLLRLGNSDILLAYKMQTRSAQMGRGSRELHFDWDFIFEAGNLQTTANTKKAVAKAQARKKMDRLQESGVIEKWDEELLGVRVTPVKQTRKKKTENKEKAT
jgi:hypothetical protein